jgi:hypothetical protein
MSKDAVVLVALTADVLVAVPLKSPPPPDVVHNTVATRSFQDTSGSFQKLVTEETWYVRAETGAVITCMTIVAFFIPAFVNGDRSN